jgi:hypothetical protein
MTSTNDEGAVTSAGFEFTVNSGNGTETYTYSGNLKFLGFSTSANKTTPDYAIGDTIGVLGGGVSVLYIVEEEAAIGVTIKYKDTTISIKDGQTITLHTTDKKLTEDLEIIAPDSTVEDWDGTIVVEAELISFTIDGDHYEAEDGMTW